MDAYPETAVNPQSIVELVPVLIAITNGSLRVLTVAQGELLPNGLLAPLRHSECGLPSRHHSLWAM